MFIVFLKFSNNKSQARQFMDGHNKWIKQGFDDGVFLLTGSLKDGTGGTVMVGNISLDDLKNRIHNDPFIAQDIVRPEIIEITPGKTDQRLQFLMA